MQAATLALVQYTRLDTGHSAPRPGRRDENKTDPTLSKWYTDFQDLRLYQEAGDQGRNSRGMSNKWRRRFRVPLDIFLDLLDVCRGEGLGVKTPGRGRRPHPLELKVMRTFARIPSEVHRMR